MPAGARSTWNWLASRVRTMCCSLSACSSGMEASWPKWLTAASRIARSGGESLSAALPSAWSSRSERESPTFCGITLFLARNAAGEANDADGDDGADQRADDVDPPPGEVAARDVRTERPEGVHGRTTDRAGEKTEQGDGGT